MRVRKQTGFTVMEMLLALAIMATLMTAVAVAFDASVANYHANEAIYKTLNTARAALLRITNDVRTAGAIPLESDEVDAAKHCGIDFEGDGAVDIRYRFDAAAKTLYLDDIDSGASYVLCKNVTALTFHRSTVPSDGNRIRSVRVSMTVTDADGELPQTLAAAAVVRRNL